MQVVSEIRGLNASVDSFFQNYLEIDNDNLILSRR